jgi:hypothetical protein
MVHFAAIVRDDGNYAAQRHIIDGKEHLAQKVDRYGDGPTYQYCILSSSDKTAADDVVSALFSFPVGNVPGLIARIYAVPNDACSTGIELFQEANGTVTVRVGGNDALRCESAEWSKPCPPEPADTNLQLHRGVRNNIGGSYDRECLVRLSWTARGYGSPVSSLDVTYKFSDIPYQSSKVALGVNAAVALLNARTLELTMYVRTEPSLPRVAVLRWGANFTASHGPLEVVELQNAIEFASRELKDRDKRNTLIRLRELAAIDSALRLYEPKGGPVRVRCNTVSDASSGHKQVTTCNYTSR